MINEGTHKQKARGDSGSNCLSDCQLLKSFDLLFQPTLEASGEIKHLLLTFGDSFQVVFSASRSLCQAMSISLSVCLSTCPSICPDYILYLV